MALASVTIGLFVESLALPPPPWIIGHRGAAGEELENTIESALLGIAQGADMIEVDVQITADGDLVLLHDWTLERLCGRPEVVEKIDRATLQSVDLSGPRGERRQIATLDGLLESLPEEFALNLELKRQECDPNRFARRLLDTLGGRGQVLVSSFDWELLMLIRGLAPDLSLAPISRRDTDGLLRTGIALDAWSLHGHRQLADRVLIREARRAHLPVLFYTINEAEEASRLLGVGATGIFTDFPGRLRAALESHPAP